MSLTELAGVLGKCSFTEEQAMAPSLTRFLSELRRVHESLRVRIRPGFLGKLQRVHRSLPRPAEDLSRLAEILSCWRKQTEEEVKRRRTTLSEEEDPLCCPISLFGTLGLGRVETAHTQALAWLLDPGREHGFGVLLLERLLGALPGNRSDQHLQQVKVRTERPIAGGRLDVLVLGGAEWEENRETFGLLIEAKIDADEGEGQLRRYESWLTTTYPDREPLLVFLTPRWSAPA